MATRALVTGATGQDGSYLVELLLSKGYEVHCVLRPQVTGARKVPSFFEDLLPRVQVHEADLGDAARVYAICRECEPQEIYHLGGPTRVDSNLSGHAAVFQTIFGSTNALLQAISDRRDTRLFFAGTSEMFGNPTITPQTEDSVRNPRSLYGLAKLAAADLIARSRRNGIRASTGILYNHESPRREPFFLSRKVTRGLARVFLGLQANISLGNLDARRDWGYAPDYVEAMSKIVTEGQPDDYVVATGETHTVRELVEIVCDKLGLVMADCIVADPLFFRPVDVVTLCGDPSRLKAAVGWKPTTSFRAMIEEMSQYDLRLELERADAAG
jgi:GDPmannose 4,6-dehydratase